MNVTVWNSACITITTPDVRILCDPWLGTGNNWDGTWTCYPPPPMDPVQWVGPADFVYISHLHDDHYSPEFLRAYVRAYPQAQLLLPDEPRLVRLVREAELADGVILHNGEPFRPHGKGTRLLIQLCFPPGVRHPIDSALAVVSDETPRQAVINLNDCPYDPDQVQSVTEFCRGAVLAACLPYLGAGEYPQTYAFDSPDAQRDAGRRKADAFLRQFQQYVTALRPRWVIPFAGEYLLRGHLAPLNPLRGLPDAVEAAALFPEIARVLYPGTAMDVATGAFSNNNIAPSRGWFHPLVGARTQPWPVDIAQRFAESAPCQPRYARELNPDPHALARVILRLIPLAAARLALVYPVAQPFYYVLSFGDCRVAVGLHDGKIAPGPAEALTPREEVTIDPRHLFGLLTGLYSWNVAQGASLLQCRRVPDVYRAEVYEALNHLHI